MSSVLEYSPVHTEIKSMSVNFTVFSVLLALQGCFPFIVDACRLASKIN